MKKIEFIWREVLFQVIEKRVTRFEQQHLARQFDLSTSTVHAALAPLRDLGAIHVGGRGFAVVDYEKILYHWANHRKLNSDIVAHLPLSLPIAEIEGLLPAGVIPTAYTAYNERFRQSPADYDTIWCYTKDPEVVKKRFETHVITKGKPNCFLLLPDPFLSSYKQLPLAQLFVDLWQMHDWYAKEFLKQVKEHIDGLLS